MTCRHAPGDPSCSSHPDHPDNPMNYRAREIEERTPDPNHYDVIEVEQVGNWVVMQVKYPNCRRCEFEGLKTMVFEGVTLKDVIRWKRIDPHFRDPKRKGVPTEAPSPVARFPGTKEGWADAMEYAQRKARA